MVFGLLPNTVQTCKIYVMTTDYNAQTPQKDNRMLIYALFIAALLGTWGYIIYDKSKTKEEITTLTGQNTEITNERDEVRELYNGSVERLDSLMDENQVLADSLQGRNSEILKIRSEIRRILANKKATSADLAKARAMINDLNGRIEGLTQEVERLQGENQQLTATNSKITEEKAMVEQNLNATKAEKENISRELEETKDIASTMKASNINIVPINTKGNGKEVITSTAKRVDKMRITFDIDDNRIAKSGEKELFIVVTGPDGKIFSESADNILNLRDGSEKTYTNRMTFQYESGKKIPINIDWKQPKDFKTGAYKIEVFNNGFKIGESIRTLKKGGLFS